MELRSLAPRDRTPWLVQSIREITDAWTVAVLEVDGDDHTQILNLEGSEAPLVLDRLMQHALRASETGLRESDQLGIGRKMIQVSVYPMGKTLSGRGRSFLGIALPIPTPEQVKMIHGLADLAATLFQEVDEKNQGWEQSYFHRKLLPLLASLGIIISVPFIPIPGWVTVAGTLEPAQQRSIPVTWSAPLEKVFVKPGDTVERGQPVAELNGDDLQRQIAQAIASQARAEKEEEMATSIGKFADADLADLDQQRYATRKSELEYQHRHLTLRAPINGRVLEVPALGREGAWLRQGDPILTVADVATLRLKLEVPAHHADLLKQKDTLRIQTDAGKQSAPLLWKGPGLLRSMEGRFLPVAAEVQNLDETLLPGQHAVAHLGRNWTPLYLKLWPGLRKDD